MRLRSALSILARGSLLVATLTFTAGAYLLVTPVAPAAADGEIVVGLAEPDDSAFPEVSFVVTADRSGRPLAQLGVDNVQVVEGGQPATVTSVKRAQDSGVPLALVVTIDTSGSMQGASMEQARAAAGALVQRLATGDSAAVIAFSDQARVVTPMTRDHASLQRAVAGLVPQGNTALYDAVAESARVASESENVRRAVVLLSDGLEFGGASRHTREQALESAAQGGAVFYMVGVGPDIDRAFLEEIATRSGGRFFQASGASEVPQIYTALEELLRGQFVVTARSAALPVGASRDLRVEIRQSGGQGVTHRSYTSKRPTSATSAPEAVAAPVAPATAPVPEGNEQDASIPLVPLSLGGLAIFGLAAFYWWSRTATQPRPARPIAMIGPVGGYSPSTSGVLWVISGPGAGSRFELSATPVTIGSGTGNAMRLADDDNVAAEHARVWWREGRPMLRHLADGFETRVNGRVVDWASLDAGYEIVIGSTVLRFEPLVLPLGLEGDSPQQLRDAG